MTGITCLLGSYEIGHFGEAVGGYYKDGVRCTLSSRQSQLEIHGMSSHGAFGIGTGVESPRGDRTLLCMLERRPLIVNKVLVYSPRSIQLRKCHDLLSSAGRALGILPLPYWRCYFPNTQAVIYVVDSSDTDRLIIAKEEFHAILEEEELKGAVVLIFANKQDLPGALDDAAVTEALELHKIKNRQWAIFKTSAIKGEGLFEGLD
ncbi:hypothetical protein RJ639_032110, partial [Escallonia herrerae]